MTQQDHFEYEHDLHDVQLLSLLICNKHQKLGMRIRQHYQGELC